jgi:hypothetical protein
MHESPTKVHASQAGGGSARVSFPRFPARRRTVEVTLLEGQTVGELMCQYTGEFTEENINTVAQLNKNLKDLDFVRPGTVIRLVDNRAPKLATPEAEWWSARGMGAGSTEAGATALDETEVFSEEKNVPATAAPRRADGAVVFGDKENVPAAPQKPQKPSLKQMVNRDGVDMRVPEEA